MSRSAPFLAARRRTPRTRLRDRFRASRPRTGLRSVALMTVLAVVGALLAFVTGSAQAATVTTTTSTSPTGTLDASFSGDNGSSQNVVGDYQTVAQTFTASMSGTLTSASAKLSAPNNSTDLLVEITELDSVGQPGTVLSGTTVAAGSVGSTKADIVVNFASPATVTAGTSYALKLSTTGSGNYAWHGDNTVTSPANWVKSGTGGWTAAWTTAFATYVTAAAEPAVPAVPASVQLANNQTPAYYNAMIGKVLNGSEGNFFPVDGHDPVVAPVTPPAAGPTLAAASTALGDWFNTAPPANANWTGPRAIPFNWAVGTETAIVYPVDAGPDGYDRVRAHLGSDNGVYVWVNGVFKFGARAPGGPNGFEYPGVELGAFRPGMNYVQVVREDSGGGTGFNIQLYGSTFGDLVWSDLDGDGVRDSGEPGLANVVIELVDGAGTVRSTTTTNASGAYRFDVAPGQWSVRVADANFLATGNLAGRVSSTGGNVITPPTASDDYRDIDFGYAWDGDGDGDGVPSSTDPCPTTPGVNPGGVFLTGNDPDYHATRSANFAGARNLIRKPITWMTGKTAPKMLLVTHLSSGNTPNSDPRLGLKNAGYTTFDVADFGSNTTGILALPTVDFAQYDVIVVASDFGGWLGQPELDVLNARSADLLRFLNGGGSISAFAESGLGGGHGTTRDLFEFLPFLVSSSGLNQLESTLKVTPFGASMGLVDGDVNNNFSHNVFGEPDGLEVINRDSKGRVVTMATRCQVVTAGGVGQLKIGDTVFDDADGDGTQDAGEGGIAGVTVELLGADMSVVATTTTSAAGSYTFAVAPGTHSVRIPDSSFAPGGALAGKASTTGGNTQTRSVDAADVLSFDFGYAVDVPPIAPVSGEEPGFPATPHPYAAAAITVTPYPPTIHEPVELGALLQNPTMSDVEITRVDFAISGYGLGLAWQPVGSVSNVTLPAATLVDGKLVRGRAHPTITWTPPFSGHHCVEVILHFADGRTQRLQRNIDILGLSTGEPKTSEFQVGNPTGSTATIDLRLIEVASTPAGWTATLDQPSLTLAPGEVRNVTLTITPPPGAPVGSSATFNVEGWIGDRLIGGISKTVCIGGELPAPVVSFPSSGDYVPGTFTITGTSLPYAHITCRLPDGTVFHTIADGSGGWSMPVRIGGGAGSYALHITSGIGGFVSQPVGGSGGISVNVVDVPPVGGFAVRDIANGGISGSNVLTFTGRGVPGFRVVIYSHDPHTGNVGVEIGSTIVGPDGSWTFTSGPLPDCHPTFRAVQVNRSGTASEPSPGHLVIIDTTAPKITIEGVTGGGVYPKGLAPTFTVVDLHPDGSSDHSSGVDATRTGGTLNGDPYVSGTPITTPGHYDLVVTGVDLAGNPTTVTVSFDITATLGDTVWYDADADAVQDAGEPGFSGVVVELLDAAGTVLGTDTTDSIGQYSFEVLPGSYTVRVAATNFATGGPLSGTTSTTGGDSRAQDVGTADVLTVDLGYRGTGSIEDVVWFDGDADGVHDVGEPGLPGVEVTVDVDLDGNGTPDFSRVVVTDGNGRYRVDNLPAKNCGVKIRRSSLPGGLIWRSGGDGEFDLVGVGLGAGEHKTGLGQGYIGTGSIGGRVWTDSNGNGVYDPQQGELGLGGVLVGVGVDFLGDPAADYRTSVRTGPEGEYLLPRLPKCSCGVTIDGTGLPGGLMPTFDSDGTGSSGTTLVSLAAGQNATGASFGYWPATPPGTGTPGYWDNHAEAWPRDHLTVGGTTYTKAQAIDILLKPEMGDKTYGMARAVIAAKLNVGIGNRSACISDTLVAADNWLSVNRIGSGVKASSPAWVVGGPLATKLDQYNNGLLCAPHRG